MRQHQFSLSQPAAFLKKALRPLVQPIADRGRGSCRRFITPGIEAKLKRLVPAQIGEATTGDEIGQRLAP
jgi:hypothetical protein